MMHVGRQQAFVATRHIGRVAVLAAAGMIGAASHAEAALYYWLDSEPGYSRPGPAMPQRRHKARRPAKPVEEKESSKPQGPLIIAISIERQKLKVYDANGFYAETPISTGMKGHPTPMGVFSIIQKHKLHHSNIYSGAPMPYMQRITWSGVAMHAGVLPGYPASHGCIRMPTAFAMKMWNWTRMGARVVVTPGEITPPDAFSHPLLVTQKVVPQPAAAAEPQTDAPVAAKADKAANAEATHNSNTPKAETPGPVVIEDRLDLRATVGHNEVKPGATEPSAPPRDQTRTADASDVMPASKASVTMSDAGSKAGAGSEDTSDNRSAKTEAVKSEADPVAPKQGDPSKAQPAASETARTDELKVETKAPDFKAVTDTHLNAPDARKDQTRPPDGDRPIVKRNGQIAAFISRKDSKLYVRQNFAPLFEVPVTIAPSERPLGTHVFTAQIDKNDANILRWSVVSLPAPRYVARDDDDRASRRRKVAGAVEIKAVALPDNPTEALDRLSIPADVMARIIDAISTGGSLIVSDQGINAGETGEGTDFIVSLR